ncbi:zinc knuckle, partial [Ostertagia ostertagi]
MSGPITLKSQKGLLTRYCNNLRRLLDSAEANSTQKWADLRDSADLGNMQAVLFELQSISDLVLNSLSAFTATVDSLSEELDETHENQVHEYIDSAQNLLDRASCTILQMDAQVKTAREHALFLGASPTTTPGILQPAQPRLPVIPVPVFSGKSKFSQDTNESDWKMQDLLRELDHHITTEERITDMVKTRNPNTTLKDSSRDSPAPSPKNPQCMFCASPYHKSLSCTRYPTISERRLAMQQRKLCLNCGKQGHFVTQCRSQGCRNCSGTRHHHTLCPQLTKKKVEDTKQWAPDKGKDTLPK